jgi:anti-sigma28 factor (negative regulator of flagellin synthesis)
MKTKNKIIQGAIALSVLSLVGGGIAAAQAASNNSDGFVGLFGGGHGMGKMEKRVELTYAQKTEMKTKIEAVKSALESGNYDAWVAATKSINENSPELKKITASNFADYVAKYKERQADMAERQAKMEAVRAAINAGDYNAWVTATKAMDEDCPNLEKINSNNFSRYVEAFKLRDQAQKIFEELGVNGGGVGGEGMGGMMHRERRGEFFENKGAN